MQRTCVVCGVDVDGSTSHQLCSPTCAREAEAELPRLVGRAHQLEQLHGWLQEARPWEVVLHPSQRRQAASAEVERAEVLARIRRLELEVGLFRASQTPQTSTDRLAPHGLPADSLTVITDLTAFEHLRPRPRIHG